MGQLPLQYSLAAYFLAFVIPKYPPNTANSTHSPSEHLAIYGSGKADCGGLPGGCKHTVPYKIERSIDIDSYQTINLMNLLRLTCDKCFQLFVGLSVICIGWYSIPCLSLILAPVLESSIHSGKLVSNEADFGLDYVSPEHQHQQSQSQSQILTAIHPVSWPAELGYITSNSRNIFVVVYKNYRTATPQLDNQFHLATARLNNNLDYS